jgi:hypothetical protein
LIQEFSKQAKDLRNEKINTSGAIHTDPFIKYKQMSKEYEEKGGMTEEEQIRTKAFEQNLIKTVRQGSNLENDY